MVTKAELQTRVTQLEVENENLSKTIELVRSQRDNAKAVISDRDDSIDDLETRISEFEQQRDELQRKNDDLAIANADYEMQIKQLRETANESHQEAMQTSRQLHEAKQKVESFRGIIDRQDRDIAKAVAACHQHLLVSLDLPINKPDCEVCETSRFIYYLLDIFYGK